MVPVPVLVLVLVQAPCRLGSFEEKHMKFYTKKQVSVHVSSRRIEK